MAELAKLPGRIRNWNADLNHSALIVADFQNYFISDHSHAFIPSAHAIIPKIKMLIGHFRSHGRPVFFTRHVNNSLNAGSMDWWWKDLIEEGSPSSFIIKEIDTGKDQVITKHQYDAFYGTELEDIFRENSIKFPVICGVMTNLCCETTVRSAFVRGFQPVMPVDATATYNRELHLATFRNLAFGFSPVMTTAEVIDTLKK